MGSSQAIKIDVDQVLRERLPRHYRFIPQWLIRRLERAICQEQMNGLLESNADKQDADFCKGVLEDLNVTYSIINAEHLPAATDRRIVFVSNHPLGGLDGIAITDMIANRLGKKLHFIVNDLLMAIKPLNGIFLPINKHGRQSRESSQNIDEAFAGDNPIIIFPAGLVSRRGNDGKICDLEWHKMFVNKCAQYHRDIIPIYFNGENSSFFYKFAKLRVRLGLKFNIEMIRLPKEVFRCKDKHFDIVIGERISHSALHTGQKAQAQANEIKQIVYNLKSHVSQHHCS